MRRWSWLALVGVPIAACSGSDFGKEGTGGQGGSAGAGSPSGGSSTAGSTSGGRAGANSAGSQSQSGAAGNGGRAGASSGGNGGRAGASNGGSGGSAGHSAGAGGMVVCPPCAAPPAPDCVGSGPCGCGPYVCPSGGAASGEPCGPVACKAPLECCNALMGICTMPGQVCLQ